MSPLRSASRHRRQIEELLPGGDRRHRPASGVALVADADAPRFVVAERLAGETAAVRAGGIIEGVVGAEQTAFATDPEGLAIEPPAKPVEQLVEAIECGTLSVCLYISLSTKRSIGLSIGLSMSVD